MQVGQQSIEAFHAAAGTLHRYPDGGAIELREALAEHHGLDVNRLVCGFGSDDILALVCRAYAGPGDEVLYSQHGFLVYPIAALSVGATPMTAPEQDYKMSVDHMLETVTERTKVVFVANPNNPTGTYISADDMARLHAGLPDHVALVIDGAYAEFVTADDYDTGVALASTADNVLMTRTFSKIYGLAGLRLGWAYGSDQIIDVINRIRGPFNVSSAAQAAGLAALHDVDFVNAARDHNTKWLAWLTQQLTALGLPVVPSVANFVLIKFESMDEAHAADLFLQERGYFLRRMDEYGFDDHLRLSVGPVDENEGVMEAITAFVQRPNREPGDV